MKLALLLPLLILANSCVSNKVNVGVFRDSSNTNCVKIRRDTVNFKGFQYNKIYPRICNGYSDQKLTYSDFNPGVLYFRNNNDSILFAQQQAIELPSNNFNGIEEQLVFTMSDTIGTIRQINIDDFAVIKLLLNNISVGQNGRKEYEFSFMYTKHSSHLGKLDKLQVDSDGNVTSVSYRIDGNELFMLHKRKH